MGIKGLEMCGDASRALVSSLSRQMEVARLDKEPEMDRDIYYYLLTTLTNI